MSEKFIDISMTGDIKLQKLLTRLDIKVQRKIVKKGLKEGAKPVLETAKSLVPTKTGRLKNSLKIRALKARRGSFGTIIKTGTREELGIPAKDKGYYPASLELGTSKQPAVRYLRNAMEINRNKSLGIITDNIRVGIKTIR